MNSGFTSCFRNDLDAFLRFKRAMGCPYVRAEFTLREFDRFVVRTAHSSRRVNLEDAIRDWLGSKSERKPVSVTVDLGVLRQFCLWLRRRDPSAFVPGRIWAPQATTSHFIPYVFSHSEIRELLRQTETLERPKFRRRLFRTLILVLYCTGLRFGEALRLSLQDVDLRAGTLYIAQSKGRSRWVPFHPSLKRELQRYLVDRNLYTPNELHARFFIGANRKTLPVSTAHATLTSLFRAAGIKPAQGRIGPRPYDFRHTFAVHRLTRWYRSGVDLHARLPWLSAYMGHLDILGTEAYLHATPQLLALAARRFEQRVRAERVKDT